MNFFGVGTMEIMVLMVVALIVFGPGKLPEVAGQMGKAVRDFRRMTSDLTGEFEKTIAEVDDVKKAFGAEVSGMRSQVTGVTDSVKKDLAKTGASKSATAKTATATGTVKTSTKSSASSSTASAKPAKTGAKASTPPVPVASKADPLAGVSFMDDAPIRARPAFKPDAVANTEGETEDGSPNEEIEGGTSPVVVMPTVPANDALVRARQRRADAGYNRRLG